MEGLSNIVVSVISLFGGGAVVAIITALANRKKVDADTNNTHVATLLAVDARMNERLARLEERVAQLEEINSKLREENFEIKEENMRLKHELECIQREDND